MESGTVVTVKTGAGYGFIQSPGRSKDLFFHCRELAPDLFFDERLIEMRVQFDVVQSDRGERAVAVRESL